MVVGIIIAVLILLVLFCAGIYNNLVRLRNNRENAFANIDVQLKQRADLIPQLVSTVKGYAAHEKEVLQRVTEARTMGVNATTINEKMQADNMLTQALSGLRISLEAYPELKANQNFLQLQNEISDIENKLSAVRRYFNTATRELNNAVQTFPRISLPICLVLRKNPCMRLLQLNVQRWNRHHRLISKSEVRRPSNPNPA